MTTLPSDVARCPGYSADNEWREVRRAVGADQRRRIVECKPVGMGHRIPPRWRGYCTEGGSVKQTQGRKLISALKRRAHTYLEMNLLGISVSPQKRVAECLRDDEQIVKGKRDGRTTWRVVGATRWTA